MEAWPCMRRSDGRLSPTAPTLLSVLHCCCCCCWPPTDPPTPDRPAAPQLPLCCHQTVDELTFRTLLPILTSFAIDLYISDCGSAGTDDPWHRPRLAQVSSSCCVGWCVAMRVSEARQGECPPPLEVRPGQSPVPLEVRQAECPPLLSLFPWPAACRMLCALWTACITGPTRLPRPTHPAAHPTPLSCGRSQGWLVPPHGVWLVPLG